MPTSAEVEAFLAAFHARMKVWGVLFQDGREKNTVALFELGIARNERIKVLEELTAMDYSEGPIKDWDKGPDLWVFGKELKAQELYIKITLGVTGDGKVVCISFHAAEHPMKFPLR
ncbi:MAG: type II toxin-antitoxin system MqsR family toxin [Flavobacteriales bacterium]|nr:type II toxin-antitoxin system MqsR family toxin [Flavobacteriales bacterium]